MRSQIMLHTVFLNSWQVHIDIVELEVEPVIMLRCHHGIGINDLFDTDIQEVIERVDVLLD